MLILHPFKTFATMNKEQIKDTYMRFKHWQEQPIEYKLASTDLQHCNNCGHEYTGNFCPLCSQKAGLGHISWLSVRQGLMDIWGLGTRSLLYTIWQLLWRPGHLISDYIDGKRQVSFPPVKMLFIVAVIYTMLAYWFIPDVLHISASGEDLEASDRILGGFASWLENNYSWSALGMAVLAVLPTWAMFRNSPRHQCHTLPEGFFIQIFLIVIIIVISILTLPLDYLNSELSLKVTIFLIMMYYFIAYKYLFGYGIWGTLWRSGFVLFTVFMLTMGLLFSAFDIDMKAINQGETSFARITYISGCLFSGLLSFVGGFLLNHIVTRKSMRRIQRKALNFFGQSWNS